MNWTCPLCNTLNHPDIVKCAACGYETDFRDDVDPSSTEKRSEGQSRDKGFRGWLLSLGKTRAGQMGDRKREKFIEASLAMKNRDATALSVSESWWAVFKYPDSNFPDRVVLPASIGTRDAECLASCLMWLAIIHLVCGERSRTIHEMISTDIRYVAGLRRTACWIASANRANSLAQLAHNIDSTYEQLATTIRDRALLVASVSEEEARKHPHFREMKVPAAAYMEAPIRFALRLSGLRVSDVLELAEDLQGIEALRQRSVTLGVPQDEERTSP